MLTHFIAEAKTHVQYKIITENTKKELLFNKLIGMWPLECIGPQWYQKQANRNTGKEFILIYKHTKL